MEKITKIDDFKPNLYPNITATVHEGTVCLITYEKETGKPIYTEIPKGVYFQSKKYDGIRGVVTPTGIISRSKKKIPNRQMNLRFEHLVSYAKENNCLLDGEFYIHGIPFGEINSYVMTHDKKLRGDMYFYCFDCIKLDEPKKELCKRLPDIPEELVYLVKVYQKTRIVPDEAEKIKKDYEESLKEGFEGLMLRNTMSLYKFGRSTPKSGEGYKFKEYDTTFDGLIKGVVQATIAREGSEKKINELGRSVTSKKKEDRIPIEMASAFLCDYTDEEGNVFEIKPVIALSEDEKKKIWQEKEKYIGHKSEFKGMLTGAKNAPRSPVHLRMRWKELEE